MALESFFTMVATHHSCAVKYMMVTSSSPIAWQLGESMIQSGFTQHRLWGRSSHCIGSSESLLMITSLSLPPCPPSPSWQRLVSAPLRFLMIRFPVKDPMRRCLVPFLRWCFLFRVYIVDILLLVPRP